MDSGQTDAKGRPCWGGVLGRCPDSPESIRGFILDHAVRGLWPRPPEPNAEPAKQSVWVRQYIRPTALDAVVACAGGLSTPTAARHEVATLASRAAYALGYGVGVDKWAVEQEWRAAKLAIAELSAGIRRDIWPLIKTRAPGHAIIKAARSRADRGEIFIPDEMILNLCREAAANEQRRG